MIFLESNTVSINFWLLLKLKLSTAVKTSFSKLRIHKWTNGFPTAPPLKEEFPFYTGPSHPSPSQRGLGQVTVTEHSVTLFLGQIALTQPGSVIGIIVLLKLNDGPAKHKPDGMACRRWGHAGSMCLRININCRVINTVVTCYLHLGIHNNKDYDIKVKTWP